MTSDEARVEYAALEAFVRQAGWEMFAAEIERLRLISQRDLMRVDPDNAHHAPPLIARIKAFDQMLEWPHSQMDELNNYINQSDEGESDER